MPGSRASGDLAPPHPARIVGGLSGPPPIRAVAEYPQGKQHASLRSRVPGPSGPERAGARHDRALQGADRGRRGQDPPSRGLGSPPAGLSDQQPGKAHYVLLNIEVDQAVLDELVESFRFNDAVLRHLVMRRDEADTEQSLIMKNKDEKRSEG